MTGSCIICRIYHTCTFKTDRLLSITILDTTLACSLNNNQSDLSDKLLKHHYCWLSRHAFYRNISMTNWLARFSDMMTHSIKSFRQNHLARKWHLKEQYIMQTPSLNVFSPDCFHRFLSSEHTLMQQQQGVDLNNYN